MLASRQRAGLLHAAAFDGRQQTAGLMADEQQHRIAGGLLEAFQQCVGRIQVHRFSRLQQYHLASTQLRRLGDEANQVAYLIDPDGLIDLFRLENVMVWMRMCCQ